MNTENREVTKWLKRIESGQSIRYNLMDVKTIINNSEEELLDLVEHQNGIFTKFKKFTKNQNWVVMSGGYEQFIKITNEVCASS